MRFAPGNRLGPYEIVAPLGEGGMGEVYRAVDKRLARPVAIKILSGRLTEDRKALSRFEAEARAVAALTHPNILSIFEFDVEGETPFVVSELLEGMTLRERLASRMSWSKAAELGAAIADGLAAAHEKGITHRDLKPENVFLTSDDRVKILDFGIAHVKQGPDALRLPSDTAPTAEYRADAPLGTVGYISPEQIRMKAPEPTSDIFSLGVILYEMIAGANPFARTTSMETIASILGDDPAPLTEIVPDVPAALSRLVLRCLEKTAQARFQSARDLAFELREIVRDSETRSPVRQRRSRISAGAAAAFALVALTTFLILTETRVAQLLGGAEAPPASVAVLPFASEGADDYVSDGLTAALINHLSEIRDLRVISRATAFAYKGTSRDPSEVGKELGVDAVITGRVAGTGDRMALHVEVVDPATGMQLWGDTFEPDSGRLTTLPGEVVARITEELRFGLSRTERVRVARAATISEGAYDVYLHGLQEMNLNTPAAREKAIVYLEKAAELDPQFARAHATLGAAYLRRSVNTDPKLMREKARRSIERALTIDPGLAEAHEALGLLLYWDDWDFDAADAEFRRAIALNPNLGSAHGYRAMILLQRGSFEAAIREATRARHLDPLSRTNSVILVTTYLYGGQLERAREELTRLLGRAPDFPAGRYLMGRVLAAKGKGDEACREFVASRRLANLANEDVETLDRACASGGLEAYRRALVALLQKREIDVNGYELAETYAELGEFENAYHYLELAFEARSAGVFTVAIDPVFEPLQHDPRVIALLRKAGLPLPATSPRGAQALRTGGAAPTASPAPPSGD